MARSRILSDSGERGCCDGHGTHGLKGWLRGRHFKHSMTIALYVEKKHTTAASREPGLVWYLLKGSRLGVLIPICSGTNGDGGWRVIALISMLSSAPRGGGGGWFLFSPMRSLTLCKLPPEKQDSGDDGHFSVLSIAVSYRIKWHSVFHLVASFEPFMTSLFLSLSLVCASPARHHPQPETYVSRCITSQWHAGGCSAAYRIFTW